MEYKYIEPLTLFNSGFGNSFGNNFSLGSVSPGFGNSFSLGSVSPGFGNSYSFTSGLNLTSGFTLGVFGSTNGIIGGGDYKNNLKLV
jgi:hypothetical protein